MSTWGTPLWGQPLWGGTGLGPTPPPSGSPVSDLIYQAYREAGVLATAGRSYSPEQLDDAFWKLNAMINRWKSERLMIYAIERNVQQLVSNQDAYTIGLSGTTDFAVERQERIEAAGYIFFNPPSPDLEVPMRILQTQEWEALSPKKLTSTIPYFLYYEPFVPNGIVHVFPVPTLACPITLYLWVSINEFQSPADVYIFPPAYRDMTVSNLAVELWRREPRSILTPDRVVDLHAKAARDVGLVKTINSPVLLMQTQSAARGTSDRGGHYNILTNRWT